MESNQKLDPEFKAKWVAALRSGEYKQAKGRLQEDGAYCCLGVAMKLCGIQDESMSTYCYASNLQRENPTKIPAFFRDAVVSSGPWKLADMNDSGKTFYEIADYIEANL